MKIFSYDWCYLARLNYELKIFERVENTTCKLKRQLLDKQVLKTLQTPLVIGVRLPHEHGESIYQVADKH